MYAPEGKTTEKAGKQTERTNHGAVAGPAPFTTDEKGRGNHEKTEHYTAAHCRRKRRMHEQKQHRDSAHRGQRNDTPAYRSGMRRRSCRCGGPCIPGTEVTQMTAPRGSGKQYGNHEKNRHESRRPPILHSGNNDSGHGNVQGSGHGKDRPACRSQDKLPEEYYGKQSPYLQSRTIRSVFPGKTSTDPRPPESGSQPLDHAESGKNSFQK